MQIRGTLAMVYSVYHWDMEPSPSNAERIASGSMSASNGRTALILVLLMLVSVQTPMASLPDADSNRGVVAEWGSEGSNDTGWIRMAATGADAAVGQMAMSNLMLDFAPGADIDNLTFEIRVNGSNGTWIEEPQILLPDGPASMLDWRGLGGFGQQNNFVGPNPHSSRLSPLSDANAGWVLPGGATVTDVIIEALRPADPLVSLAKLDVEVQDTAIHPDDGRLYIAFADSIIEVDANNDPPMIHIHENIDAIDIEIDAGNGLLHAATSDGEIVIIDLSDASTIGTYTPPNGAGTVTALSVVGPGLLYATDGASLWQVQISIASVGIGNVWNLVASLATNGAPATDMMVVSTDVWVSTDGAGVFHHSSGTTTQYDTQNVLPSDRITGLEMANTHMLIGTMDAGVVRRDIVNGNWLATWNSGNWLASDDIHDISNVDGWVHIIAGDTVQSYNLTSLSFGASYVISTDLNLARSTGNALIPWPSGGARAPMDDRVLVGDGSGTFAVIEPQNNPVYAGEMVFATGPSANEMNDVLEFNGTVYIAGASGIERFHLGSDRWLLPWSTGGFEAISVGTDGTDLFVGSEGGGLLHLSENGTHIADWQTSDGLSGSWISDIGYEPATDSIITLHPSGGLSVISLQTATVSDTWTTQDGFQTNEMSALAVRGGIAYAGSVDHGVERVDIINQTLLTAWTSTGVDDTTHAPIVVDGNTLYLGLNGFGVIVYDLSTGEQLEIWRQRSSSNSGGLPSASVKSLFLQSPGTVLVGTQQGAVRHSSTGFQNFGTGGGWNGPSDYNDFAQDNTNIYAATNSGVCIYTKSTLSYQSCWDDDDGMPGQYTISVEMVEAGRLYFGQYQGAGIIDVTNDTVSHAWEAGLETNNAKTLVYGNITYIGYDGIGIMRYDLSTDEWLTPWDSTNMLDDNGVTSLVHDAVAGWIWVGGDGGLDNINLNTGMVGKHWDLGSNTDGVTLPNAAPGELVLMGTRLYYSQERPAQWNSNDLIYSYDVMNYTQYTTIDAGAGESYSAFVHGMGGVGDILHIGISPTAWQNGDGHLVRWNHTSSSWMSSIASEGQVNRVNAKFAGDCWPSVTANCHLYAAYGDTPLHKVDMNGTLVQSWDDTVIEGPVRGIETWGNTVLFATQSGVYRYDYTNDTWMAEWTEGSGLPQNTEDGIYAMEVIGDDLWVSSMSNSGWSRNAKLLQKNGTSGQWTIHDVGSGQIPEGYGADFGLCDGIVHTAIGRWAGWGNQGGVARFDLASSTWLSDWNQGQGGLPHDFASSIACDEAYDIVYIGFQEDDGSLARYDYVNGQFLGVLDEDDNMVSEPIFPGGMEHTGNQLMVGHFEGGGLTLVSTTGAIVNSVIAIDHGTETTSIEPVPGASAFALGRAGGSSGYSRVDNLDVNGINPGAWDVLATLSTGRIGEFVGNSTHIWVAPIDDYWSSYGTAILEGRPLSNGSVEWLRAWNLNSEVVNEMTLDGTDLWVTTAGWGMLKIDLATGLMAGTTGVPLHYQQDGMAMVGNELIVGLMGTSSTAAGVQRFDTTNLTWGAGRLAAGLPSNIVTDFEKIGDHTYISTSGGLGVWNLTLDDWDDPITTADGLATPFLNHLTQHDGDLLVGTGSGIFGYDIATQTIGPMAGRAQGLVGDAASGFSWNANGTELYVSHNGAGSTRPGFTQLTSMGTWLAITDTTLVDILPSNDITAITGDSWGIHVATDEGPMMHWNGTSLEMEQGSAPWGFRDWPVTNLVSDGTNLVAISDLGVDLVDATGSFHAATPLYSYANLAAGSITANGIFVVGSDGLHAWGPAPGHIAKERFSMRRADPLMLNFGGDSTDATATARPGNDIVLIDPSNAVTLPMFGTAGPGNIPMTQDMLTITSPVARAPVWVASTRLNYSGTWDLAALDSTVQDTVQLAIQNSVLTTQGRTLHIQLQSPRDGALEVRLTYDWVRSESPSEIIDLFDRPEDGGGVLTTQWTVTQDASFTAYRIYLKEGSNWTTPPTSLDLLNAQWDGRTPVWQTTTMDLNTHNGLPLVDGTNYWVVIAIEYPDGSIGQPSLPFGPATPTDEVPFPPTWADAAPVPDEAGGVDGDLTIEWAECTELDAHVTRIWASPDLIFDAIGLVGSVDLSHEAGNSTTLSLQEGRPYWIAFTCVDQAGQHDPANATIIGPVVPTGGIDDGIPPAPLADIDAWDTPDDEGGRINVSWTPNTEDDCAWVTIYISPEISDDPPADATEAEIASILVNCTFDGSIISQIGSEPLIDQKPYWITAVAADKWGNENLLNITWVSAFSVQDSTGVDPPPRVAGLAAWDHPDDDGTAVDVQWDPSEVDDFDFYVVWAAEQPLGDVALKWTACKDDPAACGLMVIRQQRQSPMDPMLVTVEDALYGTDISSSIPGTIVAGHPIWVTVTIHDVKGNAFLTRLADHMVLVTPIDNEGDRIAPDRLSAPRVDDRPGDSGDGLLIEFQGSGASDLAHYEVYADVIPFDMVGSRTPVMILDRSASQPFELEMLSNGQDIEPGTPVWVTVVPVDTAGNAWRTDLATASATPIDDNATDPGLHLPIITGVGAEWNEDGSELIVTWDESRDAQVRGYIIHTSDEVFDDLRYANLASPSAIQGTRLSVNATEQGLDNSIIQYVSVVASDGEVTRYGVDSVRVDPYVESTEPTREGDQSEEGSGAWWEQLTSMEVALITILSMMIMLLTFVIVLRLRKPRFDPMLDATPNWSLQVEDWSDGGFATELPPDVDFANTLMPAAAEIKSSAASDESFASPSPAPLDDLDSLAGDLLSGPAPKRDDMDTDFLDDLL